MTEAFLTAAAALVICLSFGLLALGQRPHWRSLAAGDSAPPGGVRRRGRWLGSVAIGLGLVASLAAQGPSFGALLFVLLLGGGGLAVTFILSFRPRWLRPLGLALALAIGCSDDKGAGPVVVDAAAEAPPADAAPPPLYAIMYEVFSDMGSDSYLSLIDSLDVKEIDVTKARQYAGGRAFLATYNGWVFVGDPTSPIVTKYSVTADGSLKDEGRLSFANYGLMAGGLDPWNINFISATKAYLFDFKEATHVIWNPTTMEIRGEIKPDPQLMRMGLEFESSPGVVRGNRLYRSHHWADYKTATYSTDHLLGIYDVENDKLVELVKETRCPAPGNLVHKDEAGNHYFSNWIWPVAGTLMRGAPRSCVLKLPAGSDRFDPEWSLTYADVTGGREGGMFSYLGGGKALISVFHHEKTMFDATTDPWKYAGTPIWQIWNLDLQTRAVSPVEGIEFNAGAFTPLKFGARTFVMVPGKDWEQTQVYEIKDGKATPAFQVRGWSYQFFQIR